MKTRITVIMGIYNCADTLVESLESLEAQTYKKFKVILCDDGSKDNTLEVAQKWAEKHPNYIVIRNERNIKLAATLNHCLEYADTEYVARMDTDDLIAPTRFEKEIRKLDEGYDVVSCWSVLFWPNDDQLFCIKHRPETHEDIIKLAHKRSPVCHAGCVLRKQAVIDAGNYQACYLYEDYHLWVRMIMNGARFYNIQEVLYYVRTSPALIARRGGWKYMCNEIKTFRFFYNIGFYSRKDLLRNIITHSPVRILPVWIRRSILLRLWRC
mgnify:CR=1 FL=1